MEWWLHFGLNPVNINPEATETASMYPQWTRPLNTLHDLYSEEEYKSIFILEKRLWILRTKFMLQNIDNEDPELLRQIYTQHWDPYLFNHFRNRPYD